MEKYLKISDIFKMLGKKDIPALASPLLAAPYLFSSEQLIESPIFINLSTGFYISYIRRLLQMDCGGGILVLREPTKSSTVLLLSSSNKRARFAVAIPFTFIATHCKPDYEGLRFGVPTYFTLGNQNITPS